MLHRQSRIQLSPHPPFNTPNEKEDGLSFHKQVESAVETTASKLTVKLCQQSAHCSEIASLETAAHSFLETAAHSLETAAHSLETDASNQQVQAAETADRDWVCVALMSPSVGSCDDVRYAHPHTCHRNHTNTNCTSLPFPSPMSDPFLNDWHHFSQEREAKLIFKAS